ncbi:MAG TPA: anaerobic glycerol-3-phosphate dehydrogenase subunit C [Pirellulales bacterium]|jgi:anaerobic glycerol-3-phosphate dehydrogenase C subunit|nr:anaerobic glycerol-3-phosphate dehydrogenase subunit C [Pirellulales bacterium]
MDQQHERIQEDLRGLVRGEVRCDDVFLQLYASDASIYQIKPLAVVRPRTALDVAATVAYARENQLPVHARGAGTGLAGESLGPGIVVDFSSHFRRVFAVDGESVRLQPGVVHERLNAQLRLHGRLFGPDPAMSHVTTMGSVVALDGCGSHWLKYGSARRHVRRLEVVLADGSLLSAGQEPLVDGVSHDPNLRKRELVNGLVAAVKRYAEAIRAHQPKSLVNRCGYQVADLFTNGHFDLARLLVGSEGTLALTTEMTLSTQALPKHQGVALLLFDRLESAARAVQEVLAFDPAACDLMDRRHLALARESSPRYDALIPASTEALLLVEFCSDNSADLRERVRQATDRVRRRKRLAFDTRQAFTADEIDLYWQLARKVVPTLYRLKGSTRALPFVEDVAVPPESLPGFLVDMQNILKRHQVTATLFAHAGHGQLHLRPFLDLADPEHLRTMQALADELYEAVFRVAGTMSGEHGTGLSRTPFMRRQYGDLYPLFVEIKRLFDPQNVLNPGKVVEESPGSLTSYLRPVKPGQSDTAAGAAPAHETGPLETSPAEKSAAETDARETAPHEFIDLQLHWEPGEIHQIARACNGCGSCRAQDATVRMCPIFRFGQVEESSPRAKANLMRGILTGQLKPELIKSDDFKEVADLCVNCQQCRLECPAGVDIPKLMLEAKAAYVANNGLRLRDWVVTRLDLFSALGCTISPLANWALGNRQARWLLEKAGGIARGRKLPRFAPRPFMRRASRRRLTRPTRRSGRKVLYFVDTYANFHDPQLGEAMVAVLEHNGVAVYVHPDQRQSGMAMVSLGAVDRACKVAAHNVSILADAIRQGYTVVASEPSAALCLTREYPDLLSDDDARLVAQNTSEACTYLWNMHLMGKLQLDLKPINATVGYHTPCHLKALGVGSPGESLLRLVPGLTVHRLDKGCSGMAGTFGLRQENYRNSLRAGWPLISAIRESNWLAGTTECSACKMQMEQGTSKPTIHPLKLLALSYRLMPEIASLLNTKGKELIVT